MSVFVRRSWNVVTFVAWSIELISEEPMIQFLKSQGLGIDEPNKLIYLDLESSYHREKMEYS